MKLTEEKCIPCRKGSLPASATEIAELHAHVPAWTIEEVDGIQQLTRHFTFPNFAQALAFTNQVGELAEAEDHHPVLITEWGKATVTWWTHAVGGLHRNDFVAAAKCDEFISGS